MHAKAYNEDEDWDNSKEEKVRNMFIILGYLIAVAKVMFPIEEPTALVFLLESLARRRKGTKALKRR